MAVIRKKDLEVQMEGGLEIYQYPLAGTTSLQIYKVLPMKGQPSVSSPEDRVVYVISGSLQYHLDDEEGVLEAGDVCQVESGQAFSFTNQTLQLAVVQVVSVETG